MSDIYDPKKPKWCPGCRVYHPLADFIPPRGAGVPMARCVNSMRQYNKDRQMLKYAASDVEIGTHCPLCQRPFGPEKNQQPHLDHDHETNTFRGNICGHCNMALGHVFDSIETLERMAEYLKQHQEKISDLKTQLKLKGVPEGMSDILNQVMKNRNKGGV